MPDVFRPPEACCSLEWTVVINGKECDMWGFGMMVLQIISNFVLNDIEEVREWNLDVNPIITKALEVSNMNHPEKQFILKTVVYYTDLDYVLK